MTRDGIPRRITVKYIQGDFEDYYEVHKVMNVPYINPRQRLTKEELQQYIDDEKIDVVIK